MNGPWWQLELGRPAWLAALTALPLLVYYWRRSLTGFSPRRHLVLLICRSVLLVALILALCGIRVVKPTGEKFVVFAIDTSESIAEESRRAVERFLDEALGARKDDQAAFLLFARRPAAVRHSRPAGRTALDAEGTNLAAALEAAAAAIPPEWVPHVVLLTDGNQTDGDAVDSARAAGVPISTVPLQSRADPEAYVSTVETKDQVRKREPFHVDVVIHCSRHDEGTVRLFREDRLVDERHVELNKGDNRVRFRQSVEREAVVKFTARIEGFHDTFSQNNAAAGLVSATARPRVMLVESRPRSARHLALALENEQLDVTVRQPESMPTAPAELESYDLLVLSNVPAVALRQGQMDMIRSYVRDSGGGLIVVGGDRTFTAGGYHQSPLEEILPVSCVSEPRQQRPTLALVLVIDCSGSMEGAPLELAKEATREAVAMLQPSDQVGVMAFEDASRWVSPIQSGLDTRLVLEQIETITAGGGTDLYSAMDKAYLALNETFAELKHMIVLTDGVAHPADFEGLAREIARAGITVSTVGVGQEAATELLKDMARIGGGHHYHCDDPAQLAQVFALETAAAGRMGIVEGPFSPRLVVPEAEFDFGRAPPLLGYVETRPKPTSRVVLSSEQGDPLLAWWRHGLGEAVAFTSDVQPRWAAAWLEWPDFARFWGQVARHAIRKDPAGNFLLRVDHRDRRVQVTLDAINLEGRYLNGARATLEVVDPRRHSRRHVLRQVAPGRYTAQFRTPVLGTYYLELRFSHWGRLMYVGRRGLAVGYADEFRTRPTNHELLGTIARATGGTYNPEPIAVFAPGGKTVPRTTPLWRHLLSAAAVILVIDVALRRTGRPQVPRPAAQSGGDH